jgi:hypothetical protein
MVSNSPVGVSVDEFLAIFFCAAFDRYIDPILRNHEMYFLACSITMKTTCTICCKFLTIDSFFFLLVLRSNVIAKYASSTHHNQSKSTCGPWFAYTTIYLYRKSSFCVFNECQTLPYVFDVSLWTHKKKSDLLIQHNSTINTPANALCIQIIE